MGTRGVDVADFDRGRIVGLHEWGASAVQISRLTGINARTVSGIVSRWRRDGTASSSRGNCGRRPILDDDGRSRLKDLVKSNRRSSTVQITGKFRESSRVTISSRTVRRELKKCNLRSCVATKKPLVSAVNRAKRLQFAKEHRGWTVDDWKRVMWSDESRFTLFQSDGRVRVWREPHEVMDPACIVPTVQASGGGVMLWGSFCWYGLGAAALCTNPMRAQDYVSLLEDELCPSMEHYFPQGNGLFQDDNAPIHRAKVVRDYLLGQAGSFSHMEWPPQSPDLNPIENLWSDLERKLRASAPLPATLKVLGSKLLHLWPQMEVEKLQHLVESMPRRMEAVIRCSGGSIQY